MSHPKTTNCSWNLELAYKNIFMTLHISFSYICLIKISENILSRLIVASSSQTKIQCHLTQRNRDLSSYRHIKRIEHFKETKQFLILWWSMLRPKFYFYTAQTLSWVCRLFVLPPLLFSDRRKGITGVKVCNFIKTSNHKKQFLLNLK